MSQLFLTTSLTRPSNALDGELYFETDTNKIILSYQGGWIEYGVPETAAIQSTDFKITLGAQDDLYTILNGSPSVGEVLVATDTGVDQIFFTKQSRNYSEMFGENLSFEDLYSQYYNNSAITISVESSATKIIQDTTSQNTSGFTIIPRDQSPNVFMYSNDWNFDDHFQYNTFFEDVSSAGDLNFLTGTLSSVLSSADQDDLAYVSDYPEQLGHYHAIHSRGLSAGGGLCDAHGGFSSLTQPVAVDDTVGGSLLTRTVTADFSGTTRHESMRLYTTGLYENGGSTTDAYARMVTFTFRIPPASEHESNVYHHYGYNTRYLIGYGGQWIKLVSSNGNTWNVRTDGTAYNGLANSSSNTFNTGDWVNITYTSVSAEVASSIVNQQTIYLNGTQIDQNISGGGKYMRHLAGPSYGDNMEMALVHTFRKEYRYAIDGLVTQSQIDDWVSYLGDLGITTAKFPRMHMWFLQSHVADTNDRVPLNFPGGSAGSPGRFSTQYYQDADNFSWTANGFPNYMTGMQFYHHVWENTSSNTTQTVQPSALELYHSSNSPQRA